MIIEKRIPLKYWFHEIKWELLTVSILTLAIYFTSKYLTKVYIPISIGVFLGTTIALLLSFKLSQSYERWWEARKVWGAIVNDSRSLVIQLKRFSNQKNNQLIKSMAYRQIAWCYSLSQSLRKLNPLENIAAFISNKELESLNKHANIPLALLDNHAKDLSELSQNEIINDFRYIQLDNTLVRLASSMGAAERIKNTIFPTTYRITLHLFIYIFLMLLSSSLTELRSFVAIPLAILISIPFFYWKKLLLPFKTHSKINRQILQ